MTLPNPLVRVLGYVSVPICFVVLRCHTVIFIFKLYFVYLISVGFQKVIVFIFVNVITYFNKYSVFFFVSPHTRCSLCSAPCFNFPTYWLLGLSFGMVSEWFITKHASAFFKVHLLLMKMLRRFWALDAGFYPLAVDINVSGILWSKFLQCI